MSADLKGYEAIKDGAKEIPPPKDLPEDPIMVKVHAKEKENINILADYVPDAELPDDKIKEVLVTYVKSKCCWNPQPARSMQVKSKKTYPGLRYYMRSYCESRKFGWKTAPYSGDYVDGSDKGTVPMPWEMQVPLPELWKAKTYHQQVPHTAVVQVCHVCKNEGNSCKACGGTGKLKLHVDMFVNFHVMATPWVYESKTMPQNLADSALGKVIFKQIGTKCSAVPDCKVADLGKAAADIQKQHANVEATQKIHYQMQTAEAVPITHVECTMAGDAYEFFIFGTEYNVYFPDYPDRRSFKNCLMCCFL